MMVGTSKTGEIIGRDEESFFWKMDIQDDSTLINHILLLGKYYIYSQKCQNAKSSLKGFIAILY